MMAKPITGKSADKVEKNLRDAAQLMRSLSNPNRLLIVCLLVEGEHSVSDLEDKLKIKQPVLSQQLAELRDAGIVEPRREAKSVFYRLSDAKTTRLIAALYDIFCADAVPTARSVATMKLPSSVQAAVFAQVLANDKGRR
jgi:ArsR family transcriptional regulator